MITLALAFSSVVCGFVRPLFAHRYAVYVPTAVSPALSWGGGYGVAAVIAIAIAEVAVFLFNRDSRVGAKKLVFRGIVTYFLLLACIHFLAFIWHPESSPILAPLLSTVVGAALVCIAYSNVRSVPPSLNSILWALIGVHVISFLLFAVSPGSATLSGRFAGVFVNPNTAGVLALALLAVAAFGKIGSVSWAVSEVLGIGTILLSGSRTSALAFGVVLVGFLFSGGHLGRKFASFVGGLVLLVWFSFAGLGDLDGGLLRADNTRASWSYVESILTYHPGTGGGKAPIDVGYALYSVESWIGSSIGTAGYWIGVTGLVLVSLMMICVLIVGSGGGFGSFMFAGAIIVHSTLESWMVSATGQLSVMFWLLLVALLVATDDSRPKLPDDKSKK